MSSKVAIFTDVSELEATPRERCRWLVSGGSHYGRPVPFPPFPAPQLLERDGRVVGLAFLWGLMEMQIEQEQGIPFGCLIQECHKERFFGLSVEPLPQQQPVSSELAFEWNLMSHQEARDQLLSWLDQESFFVSDSLVDHQLHLLRTMQPGELEQAVLEDTVPASSSPAWVAAPLADFDSLNLGGNLNRPLRRPPPNATSNGTTRKITLVRENGFWFHEFRPKPAEGRESSKVSVDQADPFDELLLPTLQEILSSLNARLELHFPVSRARMEGVEGNEKEIMEDFIGSRALRAFLYYPVAHRVLFAEDSLQGKKEIAEKWKDFKEMRRPFRGDVTVGQKPNGVWRVLPAKVKAKVRGGLYFTSEEEAQLAAASIRDFTQDPRLGPLTFGECLSLWARFNLKKYIALQYFRKGSTLFPKKVQKALSTYGYNHLLCGLPGLSHPCAAVTNHVCHYSQGARTGDPFGNAADLKPHEGRGPVQCADMMSPRYCFFHALIKSYHGKVIGEASIRARYKTFSDNTVSIAGIQPISLEAMTTWEFPSHIETCPPPLRSNGDLWIRFLILGSLAPNETMGRELEIIRSPQHRSSSVVFDVRQYFPSVASIKDRNDLMAASTPSLDKELQFLEDGSQHVSGNLKVTDVQHQRAKGSWCLPLHADLLVVATITRQLLSPLLPDKAVALLDSIHDFLSLPREKKMATFFSVRDRRTSGHHLQSRRITEEERGYFDEARQHLVRGAPRCLFPGYQESAAEERDLSLAQESHDKDLNHGDKEDNNKEEDDEEDDSDFEERSDFSEDSALSDGSRFSEEDNFSEGDEDLPSSSPRYKTSGPVEAPYLWKPEPTYLEAEVMMSTKAVVEEVAESLDVPASLRSSVNSAGFPVIILGTDSWTWSDMVKFYHNRFQRQIKQCNLRRPLPVPVSINQEELRGTHRNLAKYDKTSPITLMLTHYQQVFTSQAMTCHLTGLPMSIEAHSSLKLGVGHRVHGWPMYHGWSKEIPTSFEDFCEEANNVIFESWWANSWRGGWRCLKATLPRQLDWTLEWLSSQQSVIQHSLTEDELKEVRWYYLLSARHFKWHPLTDPLIDINVIDKAEQAVVWQRIYG